MVVKKLILLVLLILLTMAVSAITITTEPEELIFEDVLPEGYAEKTIEIKSDGPDPVQISLSATDLIRDWVSFEPASAFVSNNPPAEFKIVVEPSSADIGIYEGYIIINALSTGNEITSAVLSAISLKVRIEVTEEEITQANIRDVVIKNTKKNSPIEVMVTIENQGNKEISPFFKIDILDANKSMVIKSKESIKKRLFPFSTDVIRLDIDNDLSLEEYWAEVVIYLEDDWVLGKRLIKFSVVEKEAKYFVEKPAVFKDEPIPLGVNWVMILALVFILIFVVLKIKNNKSPDKL